MSQRKSKRIVAFIDGQRYRAVGRRPYKKADGERVQLIVLRSHCPDCSKPFEVTTTKNSLRKGTNLNRRCSKCRKPRRRIRRYRVFGL